MTSRYHSFLINIMVINSYFENFCKDEVIFSLTLASTIAGALFLTNYCKH